MLNGIKGDYAVLKVKVALAERGWLTTNLDSEHRSFDLIAYKENSFKRIQVKYRTPEQGIISVKLYKVKNLVQPDLTEIDLYAVYCPHSDSCYFVTPWQFKSRSTISFSTESKFIAVQKNVLHHTELIDFEK